MNDLLINYDALDSTELNGTTRADYLVSLEATLSVWDGEARVYEEPAFPVAELAWSLRRWLVDPERGDFEFESMSFEEVGSVAIRRCTWGWVVNSVFAPTSASSTYEWDEVRQSVSNFITRLEDDLTTLGLDPVEVLGS